MTERRGDPESAAAAYERAVALSPTEMRLRLDYARLLRRLGMDAESDDQVAAALAVNDALAADEPERLSADELRGLRPQP